ncbi:MAG: hypothetical protein IPI72_12245 [Flavobacteriales bacterium]|nr:hypothetical protein [Flavobacteriales bacterium]
MGNILTRFVYNGISELLSVIDAGDNTTSYTYDRLGRKLTYDHPDGGLTEYKYDPAGNMVEKNTANLTEMFPDGGSIKYTYDFERLKRIDGLAELPEPSEVHVRSERRLLSPGRSRCATGGCNRWTGILLRSTRRGRENHPHNHREPDGHPNLRLRAEVRYLEQGPGNGLPGRRSGEVRLQHRGEGDTGAQHEEQLRLRGRGQHRI